ncbi:hypothetical protein IHE45_13G037900 [Dioscorea alata]|uniref:Uncharacterized protein n=1 Tax=Dioscorea alata TaxID=55571 RepID=A0ACB7UXR4_DIOAL|nr:hypothetical protein IHE45_13G037900 [Dioscorea alata]
MMNFLNWNWKEILFLYLVLMVTTDLSPTLQCGVPRSGLMGGGVVNPEFTLVKRCAEPLTGILLCERPGVTTRESQWLTPRRATFCILKSFKNTLVVP